MRHWLVCSAPDGVECCISGGADHRALKIAAGQLPNAAGPRRNDGDDGHKGEQAAIKHDLARVEIHRQPFTDTVLDGHQ